LRYGFTENYLKVIAPADLVAANEMRTVTIAEITSACQAEVSLSNMVSKNAYEPNMIKA
jgi:hypothetical protein